MNKTVIISSLFVAGALVCTPSVYAAEGQLDGQWFKTRIKTTVKKNHSLITEGSDALNDQKIKFDSGKNCYSALTWLQSGPEYRLLSVCERQNGWVYDNGSAANPYWSMTPEDSTTALYALADGSAGNELADIVLPAPGSAWPATEAAVYMGTLILKATFKPDNSIKSIKLIQPQDGLVFYVNDSTKTYGTGRSGLSMKWLASDSVPEGAKACFASVVGTGAAVDNCPLGNWVAPK